MKKLFTKVLVAGILFPILVYGMGITGFRPIHIPMDETSLVLMSYFWVPAIVFGATGKLFKNQSWKKPLIITIAALVLEICFFTAIWPML